MPSKKTKIDFLDIRKYSDESRMLLHYWPMNTPPQSPQTSFSLDKIEEGALSFQTSALAEDIKRLDEIINKQGGPEVFFPLIFSALPSDEARIELMLQIKTVLEALGIAAEKPTKNVNEAKTKAARSHFKI
jgi:hypothetical protein